MRCPFRPCGCGPPPPAPPPAPAPLLPGGVSAPSCVPATRRRVPRSGGSAPPASSAPARSRSHIPSAKAERGAPPAPPPARPGPMSRPAKSGEAGRQGRKSAPGSPIPRSGSSASVSGTPWDSWRSRKRDFNLRTPSPAAPASRRSGSAARGASSTTDSSSRRLGAARKRSTCSSRSDASMPKPSVQTEPTASQSSRGPPTRPASNRRMASLSGRTRAAPGGGQALEQLVERIVPYDRRHPLRREHLRLDQVVHEGRHFVRRSVRGNIRHGLRQLRRRGAAFGPTPPSARQSAAFQTGVTSTNCAS